METIDEIVEDHCSMPTVGMETFKRVIREHVSKKCAEQREICASFIPPRETFAGIADLVEHAPEPKLK